MLSMLRNMTDKFTGRGEASIAVPSLDGALKPNRALDQAQTLFDCEAPEDLATDGRTLYLADGNKLTQIVSDKPVTIREFDQPISALACCPDGAIALALAGREVRIYAAPTDPDPKLVFSGKALNCVNALSSASDGALIATNGTASHAAGDWVWDLMERGKSGTVLRLDLQSKAITVITDRLEYAFGAATQNGSTLVSESWRHRLVSVAPNGKRQIVLNHLPVYPSRLTAAIGGGWWMTAFTSRTQLVEFVLREPNYRKRMMAEIDPDHWIAPRLASGHSMQEAIQGAHVTMMGVIKPWAPPRSYGLIVRLDEAAQPMFSLHSRFDGANHGIVSAVEHNRALYILAKGPRRILRLSLDQLTGEYIA
ncbi:hypothetical protein [Celeribacter baekdonensis]|uniref:hypothetical protein n=1 Tax=Celeribacter baekdonensis TaxID=875171 RepID=UPI003A93AB6D